ncbi:MAG: hypothetical protein M0P57_12095 [Syntrophales bacterium]|jgi:hypothetical protein|nr:hypothetical protein [Syntrophales bacterium]MDY0044508.1 hypothetical protein [Syntrophales bacterium]
MTKIYEALEQSKRENKSLSKREITPPAKKDINILAESGIKMEKEMIQLYHNLFVFNGNQTKKMLQFISSREAEGTSTIVKEFAKVAVSIFNKSVLLMDLEGGLQISDDFASTEKTVYTIDCSITEYQNEKSQNRENAGEAKLFISTVSKNYLPGSPGFESERSNEFWEELRKKFDLILIDSPPITLRPESLITSCKADGVVLIVEAEKTRWPVILHTKEKIEKNGGTVLGVVLNKRHYYIPKFVYRLF